MIAVLIFNFLYSLNAAQVHASTLSSPLIIPEKASVCVVHAGFNKRSTTGNYQTAFSCDGKKMHESLTADMPITEFYSALIVNFIRKNMKLASVEQVEYVDTIEKHFVFIGN